MCNLHKCRQRISEIETDHKGSQVTWVVKHHYHQRIVLRLWTIIFIVFHPFLLVQITNSFQFLGLQVQINTESSSFPHHPRFPRVFQNNSKKKMCSFLKNKKEKKSTNSIHSATGCFVDSCMPSAICFYPIPWKWKVKVSLIRSAKWKKGSLKVNVVGWS